MRRMQWGGCVGYGGLCVPDGTALTETAALMTAALMTVAQMEVVEKGLAGRFFEFFEFVRQGQFRFYQERDLGLDLYHNGLPGILLFVLAVASAVVFFLAIFHVITARRHVVRILMGLGVAAAFLGAGTSYYHFLHLTELEPKIIRSTGGPSPSNDAQRAAVIALPLGVGAATLAGNSLGCLYMAVYWGSSALKKKK